MQTTPQTEIQTGYSAKQELNQIIELLHHTWYHQDNFDEKLSQCLGKFYTLSIFYYKLFTISLEAIYTKTPPGQVMKPKYYRMMHRNTRTRGVMKTNHLQFSLKEWTQESKNEQSMLNNNIIIMHGSPCSRNKTIIAERISNHSTLSI